MEFVYVVPREDLFPGFYPHGLLPFGAGLEREAFEETALDKGFFVERDYAERNPALKQIIPYAMVCVEERMLLVKRLNNGGEKRLFDKLSIGIGGHINPIDAEEGPLPGSAEAASSSVFSRSVSSSNLFTAAAAREISEELHIDGDFTTRAVGVLNDDSNPVGAVHVGLVQVLQVRGTVEIREKDQLEGELTRPAQLHRLLAEGANFESWSQLLVASLDELVPLPTATLS